MKKFKKLFYVVAIMMLSCCGILFGCGDKYKDMKLTSSLEDTAIVLYFGEEETSSKSFELKVSGVPDGVSTKIQKPNVAVSGLLKIDMQQKGAVTTVNLTAINYGETDVIFTTEEGGKTYSLHVVCELKVESISYNPTYKPYAVIGESTKISTSKCLNYIPEQTTQRDVKYSLASSYAGVEVLEDGTINVADSATNGKIKVRVTSTFDSNVATDFDVTILKGADDIVAFYGENEIADSGLFFAPNMSEEAIKIVAIDVLPNDYSYLLNFEIVDANGNLISEVKNSGKIASNLFEIGIIESNKIDISANDAGDQWLKITASISGFDYKSQPKLYKLHSEYVARNISVVDAEDGNSYEHYTIYDDYMGRDGKPVMVSIDAAGILGNSDFVIRPLEAQSTGKLRVLTGRRDSSGYYTQARFYVEGSSDYDIFPNNTILYLIADASKIEGDDSLDKVTLDFVAIGSMGLLGEEAKSTVTFDLRSGVSSIALENKTQNDVVMVPVKETINGNSLIESTTITLSTLETEYTNSIYTLDINEGYVFENNIVTFENSTKEMGKRLYSFVIYGVKDGLYNLTFYSQNGKSIDIKIRVFTKIDKITLTTATIEQNSDIGEIVYEQQNNLKTLDGGSITIRAGGVVALNFNSYFKNYLRRANYQKISYNYDTMNIVKIDAANRMIGYAEGETEVYVTVQTFDDETDGIFELHFHVNVYVAIQNIALNTKNATIYTQSTLNNFVEDGSTFKQKYGEFTFVLKINPDKTNIDPDRDINVQWSGNVGNNLTVNKNYNADDNKYSITVSLYELPAGAEEGNAKMVISVTQFGRILVQEADIVVKNAIKVNTIYDVKKVQNNISTNAASSNDVPSNITIRDEADYYLYFDSREVIDNQNISFALSSKVEPLNALNSNLILIYKQVGGYSNVLSVNGNNVTILNAGLAELYVCAVDSFIGETYSTDNLVAENFSTKVCVLIKVADGLSRSTSLEISKPSDLVKMNQNVESLDKFYVVTADINLASQQSWTPIGYINGEIHEFNGVIDGLISDNFGDKVIANITGIKFSNEYEYLGLFAKISQSAQVENLNISILNIALNFTQNIFVGGLCGENFGTCSYVSISFVNANINSSARINFGGIAGKNNGFIVSPTVSGSVNITSNELYAGGVVGENYATIDGSTNLFNSADFVDTYNSHIQIIAEYLDGCLGGVAGFSNGTIKNISFNGNLSGSDNVGGLVGKINSNSINDYDLFNSFSSGKVEGQNNAGGLVGSFVANNHKVNNGKIVANISNSSVNMFDDEYPEVKIIGESAVGGLIGTAKNLVLLNSYVRSYVSKSNQNYIADIQVLSAGNVGGVIGVAENVVAEKVYSIQKMISADGSIVGGLIGTAKTCQITNSFERNIFEGDSASIGSVAGIIEGTNTYVIYFYSSNSIDYVGDGILSADSNYLVNTPTAMSFDGWASVAKTSDSISGKDWYLPAGEVYPYIIFKQNNEDKLLTIEPPTSLTLQKKQSAGYLYEIKYNENNEERTLQDSFVLYKGRTNSVKFANLFDVLITPNDNLLNVSKAYNLTSSDPAILQISGSTQSDYRLKLNSIGKVVLTISSKLNIEVKKQITLYILNAVSGFNLTIDNSTNSLLVGVNYELKQTLSTSYINNNDFYIRFNHDSNVAVNNDFASVNGVKNNQKIFIKSQKSGNFTLNYSLFVKIDIDGTECYVPFGNDTNSGIDTYEKTIEFTAFYGIRDFVADAHALEMGLNDTTTVRYTLTGDDLRRGDKSPKFTYQIDEYFNMLFVGAEIYFGLNQDDIVFSSLLDFDKHTISRIETDAITKIVYIFEISANKDKITDWFKTNTSDSYSSGYVTASVKIADDNAFGMATAPAEMPISLIIKRQKIDNISMTFFANAETKLDEQNNPVYTINEIPSNAIIAGQSGIMKISLAPVNAEVKEVKVSYSNASGYSLSLNQVLKYEYEETESGKKKVEYLDRKPYAVAVDNGKGIVLYHTESNFDGQDNLGTKTSYDGYLYVNCIISSNVPNGENFVITTEAIYANNYKYITSSTLTSRVPSKVSIGYNFNFSNNEAAATQSLANTFVIPNNVEKEFYIDFTEILTAEDIANLEAKVSPEALGIAANGVEIKLAKQNDIVKYILSNSTCRVYYTIKTTETKSFDLKATIKKVQNSIENTYYSQTTTVLSMPYVVTGVKIKDGGSNTNSITIPQSEPASLDIQIIADYADATQEIKDSIDDIRTQIIENLKFWFGKQKGLTNYTTLEQSNDKYANYRVSLTKEKVTISAITPDTTDMIYVEVPFEYDIENGMVKIDNNIIVEGNFIGKNSIGFNGAKQYVRDFVILNLTSDASSEYAIPVSSQEEFEKMNNGTNGQMLYYALSEDITLENYIPKDLDNISFDGNGHTITINSFQTTIELDTETTYISNYGLFNNISETSIVKNFNIKYKTSEFNTSNFDISSFNFGGICVQNFGIIFNVKTMAENKLNFVSNISRETNIAGIVCANNGWISFCTSELAFDANCGFTAGFAVNNSKKISNSKVVINNGNISNSFTSDEMSLTAGFVCKNSGTIFGSYVSGAEFDKQKATISSQSTVGGFVNQNRGEIDNCYTNITIESTSRASGFVYNNEGVVTSCYSSSKIQESSGAHTPFTGTDANNNFLNSGEIEDCYYIGDTPAVAGEHARYVSEQNNTSSYAKFVFADGTDETITQNGIWYMDANAPRLLDADTEIFCQQYYDGVVEYEEQVGSEFVTKYRHNWTFAKENEENQISFGKQQIYSIKSRIINPRTITTMAQWNLILQSMSNNSGDKNDFVVVLKDLVADRDVTPSSSKNTFSGKLIGNNMKISGLYLRANVDDSIKTFGLFGKIASDVNNKAFVKDLSIAAKQVVASGANCVGMFAGFVENADIININVDGADIEAVQGKIMVGVFAGLINNSIVTKINVSGNVNAGFVTESKNLSNYVESDINALIGNDTRSILYSYSGTFAGAIVGSSVAKYINITGENKVIGFYAGSAVGLVGTGSKLILAKTEIQKNQYIRAYAFAGGLVGENRGMIDRCLVEHEYNVQFKIDTDTKNLYPRNTSTNANLNFFVGSPKFIGGFVGFNNGGKIANSYTKLDVRTSNTLTYVSGGFAGLAVGGEISNCYASGSVTNLYVVGGFIGSVTNKNFLIGTYEDNSITKRYDDKDVFATVQSKTFISSDSKVKLNNNIVSNKWLLSNDADALAELDYVGFVIGNVVNIPDSLNTTGTKIEIAAENNYFNTQILSANREAPINISQITLEDSAILSAIIKNQQAVGTDLVNIVNKYSIGAYNTSFAPNENIDNRDDVYNKATCALSSNVLVSYENMFNHDELLFNPSNGIFSNWNVAYSFDEITNNTYWLFDMDNLSASIYPSIIVNINA